MHSPITLIGWGQTTQRKDATPPWQTPLDLMADAARQAAAVAGAVLIYLATKG